MKEAPETPSAQPPSFTADWFSRSIPAWKQLFPRVLPRPQRILEIGAFEGRSTCFMLEHILPADLGGEIHCVDSWAGGVEHGGIAMDAVFNRCRTNVAAMLKRFPQHKMIGHRAPSAAALRDLHAKGFAATFVFVYVDGSHQAADVLEDLVLAFPLLRRGGVVICDDYIWQRQRPGEEDILDTPKIAIDSFTTIFRRRLRLLDWPSTYQVAFQKTVA